MFLIIGLGNPGSQYARTRHNVGFLVVDELAKRYGMNLRVKRAQEAEVAEGEINGKKVMLCKPQTFMNVSGRAMQKLIKKNPVKPKEIVVVYDDADLPFGNVRAKPGGSSAGHRGMQSVLDQFPSSTSIARVRIGIGRPDHPDMPLDEYVLERWSAKEEKALPKIMENAIALIESYAR